MAKTSKKIIQSRLGEREIEVDKIITFPRGLIGFEGAQQFTLLQIRDDAPFLLLQSLEDPDFGLLVAEPFSFLPDYKLVISSMDQKFLKAKKAEDLIILVTASIPPGQPEKTTLNLLGPIAINYGERLGLQVPQTEVSGPARVYIHAASAEVVEAE